VVNKIGDNNFHKVLRESGDWRWIQGRDPWGVLEGGLKLLDFGHGSVPEQVGK
jgi:hypothetical protein